MIFERPYMDSSSLGSFLRFGARADCTRIFGLWIQHRFDAGP
jgi:hypothetical protein